MARTRQELAREALQIQNACNLGGLAHSFPEVMDAIGCLPDGSGNGTDRKNRHPITRLWIAKMSDLSGLQYEWPVHDADIVKAWSQNQEVPQS